VEKYAGSGRLLTSIREAWNRAGHLPDQLRVGLHSLGYVAETTQEAADDFYPGYVRIMNKFAKERGWRPITRTIFDAQLRQQGALLVGDPHAVANKIVRHSKALGGISRITFQMDPGSLSQEKLMRAIELLGKHVAPALREELGKVYSEEGIQQHT
jgi:alkanesulfonate monooxygenase SsuD/methylene tetrahydromethanopterin reductase-like flavin-dependent oxidoreductase (luciferase family)